MSAATTTAAMPLTPVASTERVELIDMLRGFALLGILTVNFWGSSGESVRRLDQVINDILDIAVSASFYPLFSFLFGLGFAVQWQRARARGAAVAWVYSRRMLALFLIGAFHAIVIWYGDILVMYAICGAWLVLLHRLSDRWLLGIAAVLLAVSVWPPATTGLLHRIGGERAAETAMLMNSATNERSRIQNDVANRYELDPDASQAAAFTSSMASRWDLFKFMVRALLSRTAIVNDIPGFFLIGFVVGRRRILQEAARHRKGLAWAAGVGLTLAVAGAVTVYVVEPGSLVLTALAQTANDNGATMFYIAGISLGVTFVPAIARAFRLFAPAGRIGLTNYLLQSIAMTVVFSHYGLSLTRPSTAIWLAINLAFFFFIQIPLSAWYVQRFRFGPAEWLWRSMTYGVMQPMRLDKPVGVPVSA